jgi:hypothetical protein
MAKVVNEHRWFAGWRQARRPVDVDPADLGTAFGLDLSLHELHPENPAPAARKSGWLRRLGWRRQSLA